MLTKAIAEGDTVPMQYLKCFLVGIPQIGKTAVRRRLSGLIKNISLLPDGKPDWPSTGLAECSLVSVSQNIVTVSDDKWHVVEGKEELEGIMSFINHYCEAGTNESNSSDTTKSAKSDSIKSDDSVTDASENKNEDITPRAKRGGKGNEIPEKILKVIRNFNSELTKRMSKPENEQVTLMLLMIDVGGQAEFLEMLPLLMNGPAIYLTFFKLSEASLNSCYTEKSTFGVDPDHTEDSAISLGDVIIQILSNVAFSEHPQEEVRKALDLVLKKGEYQDGAPKIERIHSAVALLIGTFKDELKESIKKNLKSDCTSDELEDKLQDKLKDIDKEFEKKIIEVYDSEKNMNHVAYASTNPKKLIFDIDNMTGGTKEIEDLRKRLMEEIDRFKDIHIPLRWLILGIILRTEYEWITVDDCKHVARELHIEEDIGPVLWFLSSVTGMLLYQPGMPEGSDLKGVILCTPQIVFDSVSKIIIEKIKKWKAGDLASVLVEGKFTLDNLGSECPKEGGGLKTSQPRIKPTDSAIGKVFLPRVQLIELLEYRRVVARCRDQRDMYIMPALLKNMSEEIKKTVMVQKKDSLPCRLFIKFKNFCYAPLGFFSCIITELINREDIKIVENNTKKGDYHEGVRKNFICFKHHSSGVPCFKVALFAHAKWYEVLIKSCIPGGKRDVCEYIKGLFLSVLNSVLKDLSFSVGLPDFCIECGTSPLHFFSVDTRLKKDCIYCDDCEGEVQVMETQLCWMVSKLHNAVLYIQ